MAMTIAQTSHLFQTHTVRQRGTPDNPLFCATDVCRCLKIKNASQKVATINQDHVHVFPADGTRAVLWVNEAGLYEMIFSCRRSPIVREFQQWVFSVVLPSIRRTGRFEMNSADSMRLRDRDTTLVSLAVTHFSHDDQLMLLANEKLKTLLGGSETTVAQQLLPISVALETDGEFSPRDIAKHRSGVGRLVAREYRRMFDGEPKKTVQNVHSRQTRVNAYSPSELQQLLPMAKDYLRSMF